MPLWVKPSGSTRSDTKRDNALIDAELTEARETICELRRMVGQLETAIANYQAMCQVLQKTDDDVEWQKLIADWEKSA